MKFTLVLAFLMLTSSAFASILLTRDARPVDGALTVLLITGENSRREGRVLLKSTYVSRSNGQSITTTNLDVNDLDCSVKRTITNKLVQVTCSKDLRPVDGPQVIISIKQNAVGGFKVTKRQSIFDRFTAKEIVTNEELALNLKEAQLKL